MKKLLNLSFLLTLLIAFSFTPNKEKFLIVLDVPHGGNDTGSQHGNLTEKEYSLEIAKKIIASNSNPNVEFILTRDTDEFMDLSDRIQKINEINADLVISIHLNKSINTDSNGYEIYVSSENENFEESKSYAEKLISQFKDSPLVNRGVKDQRLKVVRESKSPAILFELGFVSNEKDRAYLESEIGKTDIATKILAFTNSL